MRNNYKILVLILVIVFLPRLTLATDNLDTDHDGLTDEQEINIYHTDSKNPDTDGDGYNDGAEVQSDYLPLDKRKIKMVDSDYDHDGLSDALEIKFYTDLTNPDTDGDGYQDGVEIMNGYDPLSKESKRLTKNITVNLQKQKLDYYVAGIKLGEMTVSTGKWTTPTPKGTFKVKNKYNKAWSKAYGLWMPYWVGLKDGKFGLHELPIWPNGYREGANHLGKPVSHGCIRLGIGDAKKIYDFSEVGMNVTIN